jgi:CheY-like chemotaxis protein
VYGFIKQSGGLVEIDSSPGMGTSIDLYLPRTTVAPIPAEAPSPSAALAGGHETVLVVEDNGMVRAHACHLLRELGYQVIEAGDGPTAVTVLESGLTIDLLFTDVVMPNGMTGVDLAAKAAELHPSLPVLFTSGYTEHSMVVSGAVDSGTQLLAKPYHREDLARMVRAALDSGDH